MITRMLGIVKHGINRVRRRTAVFSLAGGRRRALFLPLCPRHEHDVRWAKLSVLLRLPILLDIETSGSCRPEYIFALDKRVEDEGARQAFWPLVSH